MSINLFFNALLFSLIPTGIVGIVCLIIIHIDDKKTKKYKPILDKYASILTNEFDMTNLINFRTDFLNSELFKNGKAVHLKAHVLLLLYDTNKKIEVLNNLKTKNEKNGKNISN